MQWRRGIGERNESSDAAEAFALFYGRRRGRGLWLDAGRAALAQGLVHDDGSGDGDVERGDLAGHGDAEEVVAGLLDEVVEAGAFASEDEDAVGGEVEVGVVGGAALVETDDPDVGLLHLLEGADEVGYAGDADVFGGPGRRFGDCSGNGGAATLRKNNAVDSDPVGCAEDGTEIVGVFQAVEGEEEAMVAVSGGDEEVFNGEECPFAKIGDDALMRLGLGNARELIAGFYRDADASGTSQGGEAIELCIATLAGDGDAVEATRTSPDGLFDRMQAVKNFHFSSLQAGNRGRSCRKGRKMTKLSRFSAVMRIFNGHSESRRGFSNHELRDRDFFRGIRVNTSVNVRTQTMTTAQVALTQEENATIARGLKRQDPELLDQLIEQYQHRLLRYLLFLTGRREVAEDLFQETWMRVLVRGAQYNGKARFDTWLFTIARNLVIDLSRKRTMSSLDEMSESDEDERPFEVAMTGPSPLEQFASREDSAEVGEVLLTLDASYREVLVLRFYEEMSLEEIAGVTRAPLSTVKSRLYRGLASLRPELEKLRGYRPAVAEARG